MRKDVREFIRRLEAAGLTVESTPGPTTSCTTQAAPETERMPFILPVPPIPAGARPLSWNSVSSASTSSDDPVTIFDRRSITAFTPPFVLEALGPGSAVRAFAPVPEAAT
jgi:hypothetical protein